MRARLFVIAASIAALAYACGGADPGIIGGDGGESGDDDASSGRRDSGAGDKDASVLGDASRGGDGGETTDSGSHDGGFDAGHDAGGHPHNDGGIVPCGDVADAALNCDNGSPTCCGIQYDQFTVVADDTFACTTNAGSCLDLDSGGANVVIACRDDTYCPGTKVCCGLLVTNVFSSAYGSVDCEDSCPLFDDAGAATDYRRFCDPAGIDECSASGETCGPSTILPGFNVCQ